MLRQQHHFRWWGIMAVSTRRTRHFQSAFTVHTAWIEALHWMFVLFSVSSFSSVLLPLPLHRSRQFLFLYFCQKNVDISVSSHWIVSCRIMYLLKSVVQVVWKVIICTIIIFTGVLSSGYLNMLWRHVSYHNIPTRCGDSEFLAKCVRLEALRLDFQP